MPIDERLVSLAVAIAIALAPRLRDDALKEAFTLLMLARQQDHDAIRTGLHTLVAATTRVRYERLALMPVHPIEMARRNTRRIRAIAADIGQLILPEHRSRHRHARAAMPRLARCHTYVAVDAFAQVTNQNFSHTRPLTCRHMIYPHTPYTPSTSGHSLYDGSDSAPFPIHLGRKYGAVMKYAHATKVEISPQKTPVIMLVIVTTYHASLTRPKDHCPLIIDHRGLLVRLAVSVTLHTIIEHENAGFDVRLTILVRIVRVTVIARVSLVRLRVARHTRDLTLAAVIDREGVLCQLGRRPALDRMTGGAVRTE